jgi:thiamine-monophosphate kinase
MPFDVNVNSIDKALAVNLSDIAAMGGIPAYLILSLGIPRHFGSDDVDSFYNGIKSLAIEHNVAVIGGDTSLADKLVISACLIGHAPYRPISRSGAKLRNDIYVTGTLGDSALGLQLLKSKVPRKKVAAYLITRHHKPTPRVDVGALLARKRLATAMIDVSDGLLNQMQVLGADVQRPQRAAEPGDHRLVADDRLDAGRTRRQFGLR